MHGRIVAVRAEGPGSAAPVRRMGVESGRSVPRAADPSRRDVKVTRRENEGAAPEHAVGVELGVRF